ncbi:2,3-diketo-L-gulonate TRAP transporter small permease protein YiaM, partial [Dysosmobacter welbionis]
HCRECPTRSIRSSFFSPVVSCLFRVCGPNLQLLITGLAVRPAGEHAAPDFCQYDLGRGVHRAPRQQVAAEGGEVLPAEAGVKVAAVLRYGAHQGDDLHILLSAAHPDTGRVPQPPAGDAAHTGNHCPGGDMMRLHIGLDLLVQILPPAEAETMIHDVPSLIAPVSGGFAAIVPRNG